MQQCMLIVAVAICAVFSFATADFRKDALDLHNQYRAKHRTSPLALSNQLNNYAQKYATQLSNSYSFRHSGGPYGENLYMTTDTKLSDSQAAIEAITIWYNERSKYRRGSFSSSSGHFTQLVWNNSKYLGIGVARSRRGVYVCASYDPKGNVMGQFIQNVLGV